MHFIYLNDLYDSYLNYSLQLLETWQSLCMCVVCVCLCACECVPVV